MYTSRNKQASAAKRDWLAPKMLNNIQYILLAVDFSELLNNSVLMDAEINSLDEKVQQLAQLCQRLRKDNSHLRQQLATARDENQRLSEKISTVTSRVEALIEKIPEDAQ